MIVLVIFALFSLSCAQDWTSAQIKTPLSGGSLQAVYWLNSADTITSCDICMYSFNLPLPFCMLIFFFLPLLHAAGMVPQPSCTVSGHTVTIGSSTFETSSSNPPSLNVRGPGWFVPFQLWYTSMILPTTITSLAHSLTPSLPHSLTPSLPHSLTPSLPHSLTPSLPHSLTPSLPHSLTPSLPHSLTPSLPHSLTPSLPHSLTPSLPHSLTPSLPHSLTPSLPHSLTPSLLTPSLPHSLTPSLSDLYLSDQCSTMCVHGTCTGASKTCSCLSGWGDANCNTRKSDLLLLLSSFHLYTLNQFPYLVILQLCQLSPKSRHFLQPQMPLLSELRDQMACLVTQPLCGYAMSEWGRRRLSWLCIQISSANINERYAPICVIASNLYTLMPSTWCVRLEHWVPGPQWEPLRLFRSPTMESMVAPMLLMVCLYYCLSLFSMKIY